MDHLCVVLIYYSHGHIRITTLQLGGLNGDLDYHLIIKKKKKLVYLNIDHYSTPHIVSLCRITKFQPGPFILYFHLRF